MIHGYLTDKSNECVIPNVSRTTNFFERTRGLLFSTPLTANEGLLITPCSSVHTFGMGYAIDLIFLDRNWTIVKTINSLKPWRMAAANKCCMVLELTANRLEQLPLKTGQQLEWHDD